MRLASVLMPCLARCLLKTALNALAGGLPLGDLILTVTEETFREWSRQQQERQRREELEALARMTAEEVRLSVNETIRQTAADQPEPVRKALANYLMHVPATVRHGLRRPEDPTGRTIPASLVLRKSDDLLRFLPLTTPHFKPGDRVPGLGDWELVELLGVGGFGEVWRARHRIMRDRPDVAIKFCLDPESAKSLSNEMKLLQRVSQQGSHPGIVKLIETALSADPPCVVYEYVSGGDLAGVIDQWHRQKGPPKPDEAARMMLRLAEIVGFAHRLLPDPVVHRDLKPANILVQEDNGKRRFRVTDFGIGGLAVAEARREQAQHGGYSRASLQKTVVRGAYTPNYASPEQMFGSPPQPTDDVFSLGVIWYEMLTGEMGQGAPTGLKCYTDLKKRGMTVAQVRLLASCLGKPSERPDDANVLAERLMMAFPALQPPQSVEPVDPQPPKPHPGMVLGVAVGGGTLLALFVILCLGLGAFRSREPVPTKSTDSWAGNAPTQSSKPSSPDTSRPQPEPQKETKPEAKATKPEPPALPGDMLTSKTSGMKLKRIELGRFRMGSDKAKDSSAYAAEIPAHWVTLTKPLDLDRTTNKEKKYLEGPLYVGIHEVTVGQFRQFAEKKPYQTEAEKAGSANTWRKPGFEQDDNHPVVYASWNDAVAYCDWLSEQDGYTYRLLTEAEWEYACRAGAPTRYCFGDDASQLGDYAWYDTNSGGHTHWVGKKKPNAWGLYDMHGNAYEWCADDKEEYNQEYKDDVEDPLGPLSSDRRVLRGGSWEDYAWNCRAAYRLGYVRGGRYYYIGFRVACSPVARTR